MGYTAFGMEIPKKEGIGSKGQVTWESSPPALGLFTRRIVVLQLVPWARDLDLILAGCRHKTFQHPEQANITTRRLLIQSRPGAQLRKH